MFRNHTNILYYKYNKNHKYYTDKMEVSVARLNLQ